MRRKQLFAMVLAGAITVGTSPVPLAAEDAAVVGASESGEDMSLDMSDEGAGQDNASATIENAAEETTTEAQPELPVQESTQPDETIEQASETMQTEEVADLSGNEDDSAENASASENITYTEPEGQGQIPAPSENQTSAADQEQQTAEESKDTDSEEKAASVGSRIASTEEELEAAIAAAPDGETTSIVITADIALSKTVEIAAGKKICLVTNLPEVMIYRAEGFKENMFNVEGVFSFQNAETSSQASGHITVSGDLDEGSAEGSIIRVAANAIFGMDSSASLVNNKNTSRGGAIYSEGSVILLGGSITGNSASEGGAVYTDSLISVEGDVYVADNTALDDDSVENNIALDGTPSRLIVDGSFQSGASVGVHVVDAAPGSPVVQIGPNAAAMTMVDVLNYVSYDN